MSVKVVFWNINKRSNEFCPLLKSVASDANILLLAESEIDDNKIKNYLGLERVPFKDDFQEIDITPKLYSNISLEKIQHYSSSPSKRLIFYTLETKEHKEIMLGGIHFPSKASYNGQTQLSLADSYGTWVRDLEKVRGHEKTILFGDFNMNPFEAGMIEPRAFNATLSYDIARSGRRTLHYSEFPYFYNPMWNWLGDKEYLSGAPKLPGSFYYKTTTDVTQIYWNVFDKVIIRPSIIDVLDYTSIKILETIPRKKLIEQDCENNHDYFTDHLPLVFNLKISI